MSQAIEAIDHALAQGAGQACYTCSFQLEDVVLLDLLRQRAPQIPVLFLETGYHFSATYAYRDKIANEWGLNLRNLTAIKSVAEQEAEFGKLYEEKPAACCQLRKVEPLFNALEDYEIWFTGLRREQSPTRAKLEVVEETTLKSGKTIAKISPLAHWTWKEVWQYARANNLPILELYDQGYTSIGCEPCTALPASDENLRSGRWGGKKLECGIHTFAPVESK
ncbi:phosphoadenylyl-sulfate reductase [Bryobacter aggregatus]|uniref:phosphoadenylyl-sulfate reductase n=1 Tax=Bryobacter aggregatus TaxID=360054 RepID=UPI0004E1357E|nr:phosphoadenylyl-sulfate reductase [Bryobacter aggregatus]